MQRGTFSQRHAVVIDQENEQRFTPLNAIREGQASIEIVNSMLSEEAVLGFDGETRQIQSMGITGYRSADYVDAGRPAHVRTAV